MLSGMSSLFTRNGASASQASATYQTCVRVVGGYGHQSLCRRLASEVAGQGERLDALRNDMELHGRETRRELRELPAQLLAAVMAGIKRSAYATDLRALQAEVAELKTDVAELKRAAGE